MRVETAIPVLNVADLQASFGWFEKLGWKKDWEWGEPPDFGCVRSGDHEIFLCVNGQGSRGFDSSAKGGAEESARGVWLCLNVPDVDEVHRHCQAQGIPVTCAPADMPWNMREMLVIHPDGHVFRIGTPLEEEP